MAREVRTFAVTIPAGTALTAPHVEDLDMPARIVERVRVRVPPGPAGVVGFALGAAGVRVIPFGEDQWVVADDEVLELPLVGQIESGAWQLQGYNTGVYDHTLQVTFLLDLPGQAPGATLLTPINLEG